jgi:hypothetical protein
MRTIGTARRTIDPTGLRRAAGPSVSTAPYQIRHSPDRAKLVRLVLEGGSAVPSGVAQTPEHVFVVLRPLPRCPVTTGGVDEIIE